MNMAEIIRQQHLETVRRIKVTDAISKLRADFVNKMIEESIPKWQIKLIKNRIWVSKLFGYKVVSYPIGLLEYDIMREEVVLFKGNKIIAKKDFAIKIKQNNPEQDNGQFYPHDLPGF